MYTEPRGKYWLGHRQNLALILVGWAGFAISGCAGLAGSNSGSGSNPGPTSVTISNPSASQVTSASANVAWQTNVPATSQVEFGTSTAYGTTTALDSTLVTNHQQGLQSLKPSTVYHFRVRSRDANNNEAIGPDQTFTTASVPDSTPPSVSISSPAANSTVSGQMTVAASASDNVGVAGVQFKVDGNNIGAEDTTSPYSVSLDSRTLTNGGHTLTAVARDAAGNTATSAGVTIQVNNTSTDTTPPTVSISSPANGSSASGTITISANASDNVGVVGVQFKVDANNIGTEDTSSPYSTSLNTTTLSNASHTLTAVARDAAGNTATSSAVTINVNNAPADTTAPTVSIAAPAAGSTVSGTITVSATASDNVGVAGVQFKIDGSNAGAEDTSSPYSISLNTASFTNGSHTLTAVARDAAGNKTTSAAVVFNINNVTTPGTLPQGLGWFDIPNTKLQNVCPPVGDNQPIATTYNFPFYCQYVIRDWSGGIGDTKRNRLILWGGGHSAYYGNELYSFDLTTLQLTRLNRPSPIADGVSCPTTLSDGLPNSRHTYAGLAYIAHADKMYVYGGGLANQDGCNKNDTWTLDMATLQWRRMDPTNGITPTQTGMAGPSVAYDPVSKLVYLQDRSAFYSYNYDTNTYTQLNGTGSSLHINSVVDPKRRLFITMGGPNDNNNGPSLLVISIASGSNYALQDWTNSVSGCGPLISSASPGLAYDPVLDRIVGWPDFGNTVYLFNPDTKSCTTQTFAGGPPDSAHEAAAPDSTGTYGRFQYFPSLGVYALINDWNINAHLLRLTSGGTTPTSSGISILSVTTSNITTSSAVVSWTTNVAGTSQVDYGISTSYGQTTPLDSNLVTTHQVTLSGLSAGTLYHFRVRSKDSGGTEAVSPDFAMVTSGGGDTTAPSVSISSPASGSIVSGTVTVSASASDNVGVTSVQFYVDGAAMGSAVTAAPYNKSWDTTASANGSHTLTAQARDASGNVGNSTGVSVNVSNSTPPPSAGVNDFASRASGINVPGGVASIIRSVGFENASDVVLPSGAGGASSWAPGRPDYCQVYQTGTPTRDTTVAADGTGSLKFTINAGMFQGDAGNCTYNFSTDLSRTFGAGQEFYVQYRTKISASLIALNAATPDAGKKHDITTEGDSSTTQAPDCSNSPAEFVTVTADNRAFNGPIAYMNCGYSGFSNKFGQSGYQEFQLPGLSGPNYLDQNAAGCPHYSGRGVPVSDPSCFLYRGDEWFTIQKHIKVGTFGDSPTSVVEVWVAHEGQPSVLVVQAADAAIPNSQSGSASKKYGKITLFGLYDTGSTWNASGNAWYDDLIISTRRIPDPDTAVPNAPDSLSLSAISSSSVTVNWRVNSNNGTSQDDTGFLVERCTGTTANCLANPQSGFTVIGTTAPHASSFADTTVVPGNTYVYRVRAKNSNGNSAYAVSVCFNGGATCGGTATIN